MKKYLSITLLLLLCFSTVKAEDKPYYAFYPSSRGLNYKEFRHNIFGFSIEIPKNWIFGIVDKDKIPVVMIYPEGLNTGKFGKNYETIEIGQLTLKDVSLQEAQKYAINGMKIFHTDFQLISTPYNNTINGYEGISFIATWPSKTGFTIYEYISLIKYKNQVRSVAVRATFDVRVKKLFYDNIINSYTPFDQIQFKK